MGSFFLPRTASPILLCDLAPAFLLTYSPGPFATSLPITDSFGQGGNPIMSARRLQADRFLSRQTLYPAIRPWRLVSAHHQHTSPGLTRIHPCRPAREFAARAIVLSIPRKIRSCAGRSTCQYTRPDSPLGSNTAVCQSKEEPLSSLTWNSSQALPGSFISAASRRRRPGS